MDFVRTRVRQDLVRIRARLLNQTVPDKEPALCVVDPLAVDASLVPGRLKWLQFYGYDFDTTPIQVLMQTGTTYQDVSRFLDKPTHYHMTLNLGANGVQLTPTSSRFILKWKNQEISSIAISQPAKPTPTRTPTPAPLPTTYEITVKTSDRFLAGTDASVYITLYGTTGSSPEKGLDTPGRNDRERGDTDIYRISLPNDLGELRMLRIRHDNSGIGPGWHLASITVKNLRTGKTWGFPCDRWLATDEDDHQISREMRPGVRCQ